MAYAALAVGAEKLRRIGHEHALMCYRRVATNIGHFYDTEEDVHPFAEVLLRMAADEPGAADEFERSWAAFLASRGF